MRRIVPYLLGLYILLLTVAVGTLALGGTPPPVLTPLSTLAGFAFALTHAVVRMGWKRALGLLALVFAVSMTFKSVGVATGWVYGPYHYTPKLGPSVSRAGTLPDRSRLVHDDVSLLRHRGLAHPVKVDTLEATAQRGSGRRAGDDRLGRGHGSAHGGGRPLGMGNSRCLLWHSPAKLLGLVADGLCHLCSL